MNILARKVLVDKKNIHAETKPSSTLPQGGGSHMLKRKAITCMATGPSYYEQVNPDLLWRIPPTASTILEIGCGSGALGRAYKAINPQARYMGIEIETSPAERAKQSLDEVINGNIEMLEIEELKKVFGKVDCLIFGDVLEHLYEPRAVIIKLLQLLQNEGTLLACIPNVQNWEVILNLLSGAWPEREQGIFDRTHIRWFTKRSIIEMMNDLDLVIYEMVPRIFSEEKARSTFNALKPALEALNIDPNNAYQEIAPLQYVVKASPQKPQNFLISGLMIRPQAGMNEVRMIQPLQSMSSIPGVKVILANGAMKIPSENLDIPKIMIWQRQLLKYDDNSIERIKAVIDAGYILISEFDDDPDHWPAIKDNNYLNFRGTHAVQTSTKSLGQKLSQFNPEIRIFNNCLNILPPIPTQKWSNINQGSV